MKTATTIQKKITKIKAKKPTKRPKTTRQPKTPLTLPELNIQIDKAWKAIDSERTLTFDEYKAAWDAYDRLVELKAKYK